MSDDRCLGRPSNDLKEAGPNAIHVMISTRAAFSLVDLLYVYGLNNNPIDRNTVVQL